MSKCIKCGVELKDGAKYCKSCGSDVSKSGKSLNDKKARVMSEQKSWTKPVAITAAVIIIAAAGWMFKETLANGSGKSMFAPNRDASIRTAKAAPVRAQGGDVRIPVKTVADGNAHFFAYETGGKTVTFFVMKAADGNIRTAFDACVACNHAKLGYRQEGDLVVCNNCGLGFNPTDIGKITDGCNPIPLQKTGDGEMIVLKAKDLEAGAQYF